MDTLATPPQTMLDARIKGYPPHWPALALAQAGAQGWQLLRGDLPLPLAVLKDSALRHNLAWMQDFCRARGIDIAPHGKTTMSAELYRRQLDAGAWGISFANVSQAALGFRSGVARILIANQVLQDADLDALDALLGRHASSRAVFLLDSLAQLRAIEAWQVRRASPRAFEVLLELGVPGYRTGVRSLPDALALARAARQSPAVRLVGVETYEGSLATCDSEQETREVAALMGQLRALATACVAEACFECDEVIVSAGGSAVFDLVARELKPLLDRPVRGVLRSGCYLTHDHQRYHRHLQCVGARLQLGQTLQPALELLARVQSQPEAGLALVAMGKRDVSHDLDMPLPLWRLDAQGRRQAVPEHWRIQALNDQHAHLRFAPTAPAHEWPQVNEVLGFGISHPCTTFDKWRWMPVVDDDYRVIDAISTCF